MKTPIPSTSGDGEKQLVSFAIEKAIFARVVALATKLQVPRSWVFRTAVAEYLKEQNK